MDGAEASVKRKAPSDTDARNVKPKTSTEAISVSLSEDQAYQLLAHLPPDQELFKSIAKDVVRRSAPERRFQDAMLDDILGKIRNNGMTEDREAPARKTFNEVLREHLTQKFSEGIGRTQPSLKATRNVLLQILRAFEKSHPEQVPGDLGKKLYNLFSEESEVQQNHLNASAPSPVEQREIPVRGAETAANSALLAQDKDRLGGLRTPSVPRAIQQATGSANQVQRITNDEQGQIHGTRSIATTNGGVQTRTDQAKQDTIAPRGETVVEGRSVDDRTMMRYSLPNGTVSKGGVANNVGERGNSNASNNEAAENVSRPGPFGALVQHEAHQTSRPAAVSASGQNASNDIDALINECSGQNEDPQSNAQAPSADEQRRTQASDPMAVASTTPAKRISERANTKILEALQRHRASERESVREGPADPGSPPRHDTDAFDHTPTSSIESKALTCWYWYYRQPACQHLDKYCHYSHDIRTHVAARTKAEPPLRLDQEFARRRMVDLGLLDDHEDRSSTVNRNGMMVIKGSADKASTRPASGSVHVKSENDYEDDLAYDGSATPVLDSLLRSDEVTTPANRELVLTRIKRELLRRGQPEDWKTNVRDEKGRPKDLSLVRHEGLQSKMFGLFNTFHANPDLIRSALESLLRPLVQANLDKFPEIASNFSGTSSSGPPQHRPASNSLSSSYQPRRSDTYRPGDVGADVRDNLPAVDGLRYDDHSSYDSWRGPLERVPAWNAEWMTCPYWLKGNCVKGGNCKFVHGITQCLAGVPGKQRPRPLAPDGSILSNDQKLP